MGMLALLLMVVGGIAAAVGGIWIIVLAFQESIGWGLGSLFCGIVGLVFAFQHLDKTKQPLTIWGIGFVVSIIGNVLAAMAAPQM